LIDENFMSLEHEARMPSEPDPVAEAVEDVAKLHLAHHSQASLLQRAIDLGTDVAGRPLFIVLLIAGVALWVGRNAFGVGGWDPPPFVLLELTATLLALLVAVLILSTQRREDRLAERRAQLTLQLALLADRKTAKIIALLEELRRDQPDVTDRIDAESDLLATPADATSVVKAIGERSSPT
jgi:uncharacterized membrane protein